MGRGTTNVTLGHNISYDVYRVKVEKGDTLESIAREFQKRKIEYYCGCDGGTIPVAANYLLKEVQRNSSRNKYTVRNTAEALPEGLTFNYNVCTKVFQGFNVFI